MEFMGDVKKIDAISAIKKYGKNIDYLLCSWPPQDDGEILNALKTFDKIKSHAYLIYIGEWKNGVNASDEFFEKVEIVDSMDAINKLHISHLNSHDMIHILKLKK